MVTIFRLKNDYGNYRLTLKTMVTTDSDLRMTMITIDSNLRLSMVTIDSDLKTIQHVNFPPLSKIWSMEP